MPKSGAQLVIPAFSAQQQSALLSKVVERDGHWIWTGNANRSGPRVMIAGVRYAVRRVVWSICNGEIPTDYMVAPTCGETLCVNPEHLECGNNLMIQAMSDKTFAGKVSETHCNNGHERKLGSGKCAACNRERAAANRAAKSTNKDGK